MPLPPWDGGITPLSIQQIAAEFGGAAPFAMSNYYAGGPNVPAGTMGDFGPIPAAGTITIQQFYGSSNVPPLLPGALVHYDETTIVGIPAFTSWTNKGSGGAAYNISVPVTQSTPPVWTVGINPANGLNWVTTANPSTGGYETLLNQVIPAPYTVFMAVALNGNPANDNMTGTHNSGGADQFRFGRTSTAYWLTIGTADVLQIPAGIDALSRVWMGQHNLSPTLSLFEIPNYARVFGTPPTTLWNYGVVGGQILAIGTSMAMSMGEFIIYPSALSDVDIASVQAFLKAKWVTV